MIHALALSWPQAISTAMLAAGAVLVSLAAGHDLLSRTVPNWVSLAIAACGIVAAAAQQRLLISSALGLVIFLAAAFCWRRGWMGGADVKLLGAIGILLPPGLISSFAIAMSLTGAAHAVVYLLARGHVTPPRRPKPRSLLARGLRAERWRISRGGPLPYACAIAAGFFFVVLNGAAP